jgi:tetratricopeptide (TPR) repeat protein
MDTPNSIDNLNEFMAMSFKYKKDKDLKNALKYAALASVSTDYPRADVCCHMGDLYLEMGNLVWARFWFEAAIGNIYVDISGEKLDESFYTWIPMLRLSYIMYTIGDIDKAIEYNNAVLLIQPENEDAISNAEVFKNLSNTKQE